MESSNLWFFCDWFLSLSNAVFKVHLYCSMYLFIFIVEQYSIVWLHHTLIIHSSIDRHLDCLHCLAIMNNGGMLFVYRFCMDICFHFAQYIYLVVELLGPMLTLCLICFVCVCVQRTYQCVFQSSCIILYSHQQLVRVYISPHPYQFLSLSFFLIITILVNGSAKECSNYCTIVLISHASKVMLKILQARLQQYINQELPDVQAGFGKGRGTRNQIASIGWIIEKAR